MIKQGERTLLDVQLPTGRPAAMAAAALAVTLPLGSTQPLQITAFVHEARARPLQIRIAGILVKGLDTPLPAARVVGGVSCLELCATVSEELLLVLQRKAACTYIQLALTAVPGAAPAAQLNQLDEAVTVWALPTEAFNIFAPRPHCVPVPRVMVVRIEPIGTVLGRCAES